MDVESLFSEVVYGLPGSHIIHRFKGLILLKQADSINIYYLQSMPKFVASLYPVGLLSKCLLCM